MNKFNTKSFLNLQDATDWFEKAVITDPGWCIHEAKIQYVNLHWQASVILTQDQMELDV